MASLVLGAAGAVVGSFFGPLGASIGWSLGSALGSALDPQKSQGPRLTDLKLQQSQYGQMIPIVYGTIRIAGNVIWQTKLHEHSHTSGGKGGPQVTNYTYSASFAVQLCEGPVEGITRIWANSRLVYDTRASSGPVVNNLSFTFYPGDETQLPDPTMEAELGAGNVPANRGTAYVVFDDLDLTAYGNVIPMLTFEIATQGAVNSQLRMVLVNNNLPFYFYSSGHTSNTTPRPAIMEWPTPIGTAGPIKVGNYGSHLFGYTLFSTTAHTFNGDLSFIATGGSSLTFPIGYSFGGIPAGTGVYDAVGYFEGQPVWVNTINPTDPSSNQFPSVAWGDIQQPGGYGNAPTTAGNVSAFLPTGLYVAGACVTADGKYLTIFTASTSHGTIDGWYRVAAPQGALVYAGGGLVSPSLAFGTLGFGHVTTAGGSPGRVSMMENNLEYIWVGTAAGVGSGCSMTVYSIESGSLTLNAVCGSLDLGEGSAADPSIFVIQEGYCGIAGSKSIGVMTRFPADTSLYPTLADVVSDVSVRAGLTTNDIDVSELTDTVYGYALSQQGAARSAIEPLQSAYFFDAVEHDTVMRFVKRNSTIAATLTSDDLAARSDGSQPPAVIEATRTQEDELPAIINVTYINRDADYLNGTQRAQRQVTSSELAVALNLAIVLPDAQSKAIAEGLLYNSWLEREQLTFYASRKWIHLEPTDVVTVVDYEARITGKTEGADGVIKFDAVRNYAQVFIQAAVAAPPGGFNPPPPPTAGQSTDLVLLDIPLVADTDAPNGYYAAMAGRVSTAWPGATIFKSNDAGVSYSSLISDIVPDRIGIAQTKLGNYGGGNTFDEGNSVEVTLTLGSAGLASDTMINVLNGANEAALGSELIQFRNAALLSDSPDPGYQNYMLTGLLRGRRGTEWAMASHAVGEEFVMLPTSTNIPGSFAELGQVRDYKAVTSGQALADAINQSFVNRGAALRPYSPVNVGGGVDGSGNVTINWTRRSRIGGAWADLADVPLGEASEQYVLMVWNSDYSLCARVVSTLTAPTFIYTAAMQTTDFGAQQQTVFFSVGQLGSYGLGITTPGTAPGAGGSNGNPIMPVTPYGGPPAGGGSGCTKPMIRTNLPWNHAGRILSGETFDKSMDWVIDFTPTTTSGRIAQITFYEYVSAPAGRHVWLSTGPCGPPISPVVDVTGIEPNLFFSVGPNSSGYYPALVAGTKYYITVENKVPTPNQCAAEILQL